MFRKLARLVGLAAMVVVGVVALRVYQDRFSTTFQIRKLEDEKHELQQIVQRLGNERRVAELLVTEQTPARGPGATTGPAGPRTTVLFVEYGRDGSPLPPKSFTIDGTVAHVDALVVKFDNDFVGKDDPLRGHSIALFTKIYGDEQKPVDGSDIDAPGQIPAVYRGADPRVSEFERDLWKNFWRLTEDGAYRQSKGVRIANGEGPWWPLKPDTLYTLTLEAAGGLNVTAEPVKGIYREALKHRTG